MSDSASERTQEPTPRRRQLARQQGHVARSAELTTAVVCLSSVGSLLLLGPTVVRSGSELLQQHLSQVQLTAGAPEYHVHLRAPIGIEDGRHAGSLVAGTVCHGLCDAGDPDRLALAAAQRRARSSADCAGRAVQQLARTGAVVPPALADAQVGLCPGGGRLAAPRTPADRPGPGADDAGRPVAGGWPTVAADQRLEQPAAVVVGLAGLRLAALAV